MSDHISIAIRAALEAINGRVEGLTATCIDGMRVLVVTWDGDRWPVGVLDDHLTPLFASMNCPFSILALVHAHDSGTAQQGPHSFTDQRGLDAFTQQNHGNPVMIMHMERHLSSTDRTDILLTSLHQAGAMMRARRSSEQA